MTIYIYIKRTIFALLHNFTIFFSDSTVGSVYMNVAVFYTLGRGSSYMGPLH